MCLRTFRQDSNDGTCCFATVSRCPDNFRRKLVEGEIPATGVKLDKVQ